jgi:hypothetical protein
MKVILFGGSIRHSGAHAPLRERTRNPEPERAASGFRVHAKTRVPE